MSESECCHCHRSIPLPVYALHTVHCERFLYLCPHCQELIPKAGRSDHDFEYHTTAECPHCNEQFDIHIVKEHSGRCELRPRACVHCGGVYLFEELIEHEESCGVRTEKCEWCQEFVQVRDMSRHLSRCEERW